MSKEFKEGELVRIIGNEMEHEFAIGDIVRIVRRGSSRSYVAEQLDKGEWWLVGEKDVEPLFKEGDKVRFKPYSELAENFKDFLDVDGDFEFDDNYIFRCDIEDDLVFEVVNECDEEGVITIGNDDYVVFDVPVGMLELITTKKEVKEVEEKIEVGDIISGNSDFYTYTNRGMTEGLVLGVREDEILFRILKHEDEDAFVSQIIKDMTEFWLPAEHFKLVRKAKDVIVESQPVLQAYNYFWW